MITDRKDYDVVVMGGGLAGLSIARQILLGAPEATVLVVERMEHPVPEAAHKVGEATVEMSAHYFAEALGLRNHLDHFQTRKMGLRFFPTAQSPPPPLSERSEVGPSDFLPLKTFQVDRGRLENTLGEKVVEAGGEFRHGCRVLGFELQASGHTVEIECGGERDSVRGRWVLDASGRRGLIKNKLNLQQTSSHDCNAVWLRLSEMIWLDNLIDEQDPPLSAQATAEWLERVPSRERWRSTNHLMGRGYWAWLIPLASGSISIGVVADPRHVPFEEINTFDGMLKWMEHNEPELGRAIQKQRATLQDFRILKHYAHGCKQVFSGERWALTGEAGVFTDPLYSPGGDFIALSNTFITDLVLRDLAGEPIEDLAARCNAFYLGAFQAVMPVWEDQYGLMGNPQVWAAKCTWDIFTYFAVLNLLYHNGLLTDMPFMESIGEQYGRFTLLNHRMQAFFREWDEADSGTDRPVFVNVSSGPAPAFAKEVRHRMAANEVRERIDHNIDFIEDVARVMMAGAAARLGVSTVAADIDPLAFTLDGSAEVGVDAEDGAVTGARSGDASSEQREASLARAAAMLEGVWHTEVELARAGVDG